MLTYISRVFVNISKCGELWSRTVRFAGPHFKTPSAGDRYFFKIVQRQKYYDGKIVCKKDF